MARAVQKRHGRGPAGVGEGRDGRNKWGRGTWEKANPKNSADDTEATEGRAPE